MIHGETTEAVLGEFFRVYNTLGYGFLEKVYENALAHALRQTELQVETQFPISVYFDGQVVGEYFADILVNRSVIIEIKTADKLIEAHEAQLLNYLKATEIEVGLLLNFGPTPIQTQSHEQPLAILS